ncbi:hypothetical protein [Sulfurimonas sp.]|uniref:hypothetical protein n=1 Tax=Sulfurimonas sp. TaxID=2022749 RepID=UPI0025E2B06A|nr:hypothetical protein [Sulfurimonas sp.]MBW6488549.1 hypothetical protein [Sulfurimonas sp.]
MKKIVLGISLLIAAMTCNAGDSKFIQFALKQAHDRGFMGCDAAITSAFENAGGDDIRVNTQLFDDTKNDSLKLTATYGSKGDSVFLEVELRTHAGKCFMTKTSVITSTKSCTAYASEMKAFEFVAETADYVWTQNKGGVIMLLKPLNGGCITTFQRGNYF